MKKTIPAVFLMGPTASGKSDLAVALAERFPFEIVSVDSALVYRGMDIGTAKPSALLRARIPHHLIDIRDPAEAYSAAAFRRDALSVIDDIHARGRVALLAGGTMLYFRALERGLSVLPESQPAVRIGLERRLDEQGSDALHAELARLDPVTAARVHPNDPQRILRALEVFEISGQPMSRLIKQQPAAGWSGPLLKLAMLPADRGVLHDRIASRFDAMLDSGFVDEVAALRARGDLNTDMPSMRAVGYRQVWRYLDGEYEYARMRERGVVATRQLAKRQMTWLRSEPDLQILDMLNYETRSVSEQIGRFLDHIG